MKNQTTYTMLVRSVERSRDVLELVVYAICILSVIAAIWQFVEQSSRLSVDGLELWAQPEPVALQHTMDACLDAGS